MLAELHPPLSAFPFALTTTVVLSEFCALLTKNELFARGAHYLLLFCCLVGVGTYYSGYFSAEAAQASLNVPRDAITTHQSFAKASLILLFIALLLSQLRFVATRGRKLFGAAYGVILGCGFGLVVYTGFLGGELVFSYGVGVRIMGVTP